ncbi:MAG: discoidin domain-containing protein [Thermoguttaceae bacterium]
MNRQNTTSRQIVLFAMSLPLLLPAARAYAAAPTFAPNLPNAIVFPAHEAKFVRVVIFASSGGQPCIDELEIYGQDGKTNLALAKSGAKATASSCLPGYAIHKIEHLNDGLYGNGHSWIAAGTENEWVQIELPAPAKVAKVVFSRDREGRYEDRMPLALEIRLSLDGRTWRTVSQTHAGYTGPVPLPEPITWDGLLRYAFLCERKTWLRINPADHISPLRVERSAIPGGEPYWGRIARLDPLARTLVQMEEMIARLAAKGLDLEQERGQLAELRRRCAAQHPDSDLDAPAAESLYLEARQAKRKLMFRDPDLAPLQRILFVKRHPYLSSHNYSDILDSQFRPGGGVCLLEIPRREGRLQPADAKLVTLFDASHGIARDAVADFEAKRIYFAYRPEKSPAPGRDCYWHLMAVNADGSHVQQLTDGPFHDDYPCPLPDGGLSFVSTRCRARFLCWRPQAFVLFRMDADGENVRPLSFANISEWSPAVMHDGRILWTRSEYVDKGANFGHTLWAIRPDGTYPELIFGNDTINCYMNGREVPGSRELCCTIISHGGDHNGPLGLIDLSKGPFDSAALTNITPDIDPRYDMNWPAQECFRDPAPVSRDYFLASHASADRWGLYVVDRYGNRELLYLDPRIGSMCPTPLRPRPRPPLLNPQDPKLAESEMGQFTVADVYQGIEPLVPRGKVKYLRVCQEVRSDLDRLPNGEFRKDHGPVFEDFYATPVHLVSGPFGWPSYVAKASLGLVPVEADGSASFQAPAGKVLYFEALDENLNELQRMRSVVQLQPGEQRSCVGCHENRQTSPPVRQTLAARRAPSQLQEPSWGAEPFSYEAVVQPVWDANCVRCHDAGDKHKTNLAGTLGTDRVPASYRTLIADGWVHYFDWNWGQRHHLAPPMSFGTLKSRLWQVLDAGHYDVKLTRDEMHRVKCWIDLNCPLWPDYQERTLRNKVTQKGR